MSIWMYIFLMRKFTSERWSIADGQGRPTGPRDKTVVSMIVCQCVPALKVQ